MSETSSGGPYERTVGRWYSVTRDGLACLCLDEANAREMAAQCDRDYPQHAPHTAMILGDVTALCAEVETLRNVVELLERRVRPLLPYACGRSAHEASGTTGTLSAGADG